jgi:signal transduction histidine kinase
VTPRAARPARSLKGQLLFVVLVTTLVAVLVALGAMVAYDVRLYQKSWEADIRTQAELLGRTTAPALQFDDPQVARENLGLLRYRPGIRAAAIYDQGGARFAEFVAPGAGLALPALPGADGSSFEGGDLVVFQRIVADDRILGTVYLRAAYDLVPRLASYLGIALVAAGLAMAIAYLLSARLQRIVSQPILTIGAVARGAAEDGDYSLRVDKPGDDEIGRLAESFNALMAETQRRTRDLETTIAELGVEIRERTAAELEVSRLNAELEQRVQDRTEQYRVANRELEAFCYSVSHDLRAPLRAIHGFSKVLIGDFPDGLPASARDALSRIIAAAERMGHLIEDLLRLSQVSRGELSRQPTDLAEVATQVVAALRAGEPDREVEVQIWDGMPADADPRLVRTALENLIGNAWKFTSKTARPRIEVGCLRDGGRRVYFVRDNGAGFDMEFADKLFGPFQRLHRADEYPGTGIGLATVARVVLKHGGRIWAEAQEGRGAVFYFTLERDDDGAATAAGHGARSEGVTT